MQAGAGLLLALAGVLAGPVSARPPAAARVVCIGRNGLLAMRRACKKQEVAVSPTTVCAGDAGGLAVLDANDNLVGLVTGMFGLSIYGIGTTSVAFQAIARGDSTPNFFTTGVDANGFEYPGPYDEANEFRYDNDHCSGTKYVSTSARPGPDVDLYHSLTTASDGRGYFVRAGDPLLHPKSFGIEVVYAADAAKAVADCATKGGTAIGDPAIPCPGTGDGACVRCCEADDIGESQGLVAMHVVDLQALGLTPPFRLRR